MALIFETNFENGSFIDKVGGLELTIYEEANITRSVDGSDGRWSQAGTLFGKNGAGPAGQAYLDPWSTPAVFSGDFVIEFVAKDPIDTDTQSYLTLGMWSGGGIKILSSYVHTQFNLVLKSDDAVTFYGNWSSGISDAMNNGKYHKFRIAGTIGGNIDLYIDGNSLGTVDSSTLSGKTITPDRIYVGANYGTRNADNLSLRELRITNGNKTNNSGGPGQG